MSDDWPSSRWPVCVWGEAHHRPNGSPRGLVKYRVSCGGGGEDNQMARLFGLLSSQGIPEPGGVSMRFVYSSPPSPSFPITLMPGIPWDSPHMGTTPPCLGTTGEAGEINPEPLNPTVIPTGGCPAGQTPATKGRGRQEPTTAPTHLHAPARARYIFRNWDCFSSVPGGIHIILENA